MTKVNTIDTILFFVCDDSTVDDSTVSSILSGLKTRSLGLNPGEGGGLLVSCVPMHEQKNNEKGYFFRARQCEASQLCTDA